MNRRDFLGVSAAALWPRRAPLKVAQIGTAHGHADGKMETLRKLPALYEVVGVAGDPADLKRPAYRDVPVLPEAELLAKAEVVAVETAVPDLVPTALRCVAAGRHVHLDKPPGPSLPRFRTLLGLAREKKVLVQLGYMFRYNPAFRLGLQAVRDGRLGGLIEVNGVIGKKSAPAQRASHAPDPGGTMYELGCHLIDALVALAGPPERVTAHVRKGPDGRAENQLAVFDFPGFAATIRSQITDPFGGPRRQFSIVGTKGFLDIRPLEPPQAVLGIEGEGAKPQTFPAAAGRYDAEFVDLAAAIRGEKALPFGPDHDLAVHEAVLRASGMTVE
jgi:predicted dehydrogenase